MTDDRPESPEPQRGSDEFEEGIAKLSEQAERLNVERPQLLDEEFEQRMKALEEKASAQKALRDNIKKEEDRKRASSGEASRGLGIGMSIAYTIIGLPVLGYGVGYLIDKSQGTAASAGFGMLIGAVLGIASAIFLLSRTSR